MLFSRVELTSSVKLKSNVSTGRRPSKAMLIGESEKRKRGNVVKRTKKAKISKSTLNLDSITDLMPRPHSMHVLLAMRAVQPNQPPYRLQLLTQIQPPLMTCQRSLIMQLSSQRLILISTSMRPPRISNLPPPSILMTYFRVVTLPIRPRPSSPSKPTYSSSIRSASNPLSLTKGSLSHNNSQALTHLVRMPPRFPRQTNSNHSNLSSQRKYIALQPPMLNHLPLSTDSFQTR